MAVIRKGDLVTYHYKNSLVREGILHGYKGLLMEVVKRDKTYVYVKPYVEGEDNEVEGVATRLSYVTFHSRPKK